MINPLIPQTDEMNYYKLALLVGKRAKQIIEGAPKLTSCPSVNAITVAISEYKENKFTYIDEANAQKDTVRDKRSAAGADRR